MRVLGIAVSVSNWKSTVGLVLLEGGTGDDETTVEVVDHFPVIGNDAEWAVHVANVATAVRGHVQSMDPDVVILRRADQAPHGRKSDGPKLRLMVEGGIVAACLDVTSDVQVRTGAECGKLLGIPKKELDAKAERITSKAHREAASAALSALV